MQQTFGLIKTHAVAHRWYVIERIRRAGLTPRRVLQCALPPGMAEHLYAAHRDRPYWPDLMRSVSGPVVRLVIEGENAVAAWRDLIGASDWRNAAPGTIRHALANREGPMAENAVHGSDSVAAAQREIAIAFPPAGDSAAAQVPVHPRGPQGAEAEFA